MRIGIDIGGVISKYPDIFRPLVQLLLNRGELYGIETFIISDMKPHEKAIKFCHDNGFFVPVQNILIADYETHRERCKAVLCQEYNIDILIDDHPGYVSIQGMPLVRLLMMPDADRDYFSEKWSCSEEDAKFGRRSKKPE